MTQTQQFDCFPSNPECEYSEEHVSPDPASRTRTICLAHHDQIEAAKAEAEEQARREAALRANLDSAFVLPRATSANYDESPF